ncbi:mucin-5AC-like [Xiphophorus couchianus]|uniref:mucin-5AC-like n=1 Tax=Xiphophorus couchianus TaxID=32473 RepID=UPI0010166B23|nr:mucin-5AC-like [Xiphophorus couchianus]
MLSSVFLLLLISGAQAAYYGAIITNYFGDVQPLRNINLLVSDPDGDDIRCRYAAGPECNTCTPPSVLSLSSSCSLSFSPTNSSNEGPYAVQMMVEDFPRQTITLTDGNTGVHSIKSNANQALEISIRAEATQAETTELLFSGPPGSAKSSSGSGNFTLTWTPIAGDGGLNYPLCFVVQANSSGSVYQSDLRCVFVTTGNTTVSRLSTTTPPQTTPPQTTPPPTTTTLPTTTNQPTTTTTPLRSSTPNATPDPGPNYVLALDAMISTTLLMETDSATIMNLIKEELKRQGLPSDITLKLLSSRLVGVTTPAP